MRIIGVDVGKKRCQACIMEEDSEILDEFPFANNGEGIQRFLEQIDGEGCKAVLESTGNLWLRVYEDLESHSAARVFMS